MSSDLNEKSDVPPTYTPMPSAPPAYSNVQPNNQPIGMYNYGQTTVNYMGPPAQPEPTTQTPTQMSIPSRQTIRLHRDPIQVQCPFCLQTVVTEVDYVVGGFTWCISALCALSCCWLGCCLLPFCVKDCKDTKHICPNCKGEIGTYQRLKWQ